MPPKTFWSAPQPLDADHYRLHAVRGEIARLEEHNEDAVREYNAALNNLPEAPPRDRCTEFSCT